MNKRLFIGSLPFSTTADDLKALFSNVGTVVSADVIIDKFTDRSKGFAFVEMSTEEESAKAVETYHNYDIEGRKIIVAEAKPMEKREFAPRGNFSNDRRPSYGRGGGDRGRGGFSRGGGRKGFGR